MSKIKFIYNNYNFHLWADVLYVGIKLITTKAFVIVIAL